MEFTKEEIETALKTWDEYSDTLNELSYADWLNSLLKPETKKIVVEVEYDDNEYGMSAEAIYQSINSFDVRNEYVTKVKELPEVFSREDMIDFAEYYSDSDVWNLQIAFDNWLSERK